MIFFCRNNDEENGQSLSNSDVEDEWTVRNVDGNSCSLDVHDGRPGCKYQLSISAISASGTSLPSDCVYVSIPPTVPSPPSSFQVFPHGIFFSILCENIGLLGFFLFFNPHSL